MKICSLSDSATKGFTLIELSIVLVIIGLIIGGILTGRDLIDTAAQRAQISQIQKYNTAVEAFRGKYGGLPGDLPDPGATGFGFQPRGQYAGEGDGNGVIEGNCNNLAGENYNFHEGCGEFAVFWEDMSESGLIDAGITGNDKIPNMGYAWNQGFYGPLIILSSVPGVKDRLPPAKIGSGNFVYVESMNSMNYFGVSAINAVGWELQAAANPGITVQQAYNIDTKIDDGLPQSGNVLAIDTNTFQYQYSPVWAAGNNLIGASGAASYYTPTTAATAYATTNCFDNATAANLSGATGPQKYSLFRNASVQNCGLSFGFQ